ncbi:hypothetical protein F7R91_30775 [Streptomyces luteolifulvus]|uniref:Lipoprotein n=1 Tax=Streptomyces luteolifulvus TaxID=2615112 RepID=A0A6H9UTB0_9ACTN|nr:hypothetical protein [Streptomyces luteolifulvus]KAB1142066.1 hypothetical protein F7R91_30775 [Streptomyces luteolifulvus]
MPFPPPSRTRSGPRRRSLLASAAGAALLAGCSDASEDSAGTSGSPSAAQRARARAARESGSLVESYDAVLAVHPALAEHLAPLRAETVRHAEAFGGSGAAGQTREASPANSSAPAPSSADPSADPSPAVPGNGPAAVPANEKDALAQLAAAERALADRRTEALLGLPGELARLLASVAAAGAAHAYLLTEGAR